MNTAENPNWCSSDFIADDPVLDFLNTTGAKGKQRTNERLCSSRALFDWGLAAHQINEDEYKLLTDQCQAEPVAADNELNLIILWREAVHGLLHALGNAQAPETAAAQRVETAIKQALVEAQLRYAPDKAALWHVDSKKTGIATLRHRLALHLSEAITSGKYQLVKECEACTWMFIDTSRSRRRRWCSMSTCGNRAKARRFYQGENKS